MKLNSEHPLPNSALNPNLQHDFAHDNIISKELYCVDVSKLSCNDGNPEDKYPSFLDGRVKNKITKWENDTKF
jgi:hypothetical protein